MPHRVSDKALHHHSAAQTLRSIDMSHTTAIVVGRALSYLIYVILTTAAVDCQKCPGSYQ